MKALLITLLLTASTAVLAAGDPKRGKEISATCVACHGAAGVSPTPAWPNLAGQKAEYMVLQLKAFKSGERKNALMSPNAQTLSDKDMEDLAAYYSSL